MGSSKFYVLAALLSSAILFSGCPMGDNLKPGFRHDVLQLQPNANYQSSYPDVGPVTITEPSANSDLYLNNTYVMKCPTVACDFGFTFTNLDQDSDVNDIFFLVNVDDPSKLLFTKIIGQVALFATYYTGVWPPLFLDGTAWKDYPNYPGNFNWYQYGRVLPNVVVPLNAFVSGAANITLHIAVVGRLKSTNQWVTTERETEITLITGSLPKSP